MRPRGRTALVALACATALLGCADGGPSERQTSAPVGPETDSPPSTGDEPGAAPSEGDPPDAATTGLLDVSGRSLDGGRIDLAAAHGDQVALWMWAPW
ncbi:hypothetical protein [Egicoccus sp. AB-alg6-2]|uniref:hypothetical protein n=1 Tax=Egicoccus sp. AB-alg6-2 TaxID=3242692 RepID=UPI00359D5BE8